MGGSTWVLVEGASDVAALRALRARDGISPEAEPCRIVAMGGATNIRRELDSVVAQDDEPRVLGLCDEREARFFARALDGHREALHLAGAITVDRLPALGFQICRVDLEDELMRALGVDGTMAVFERLNLRGLFEAFTHQLAWQDRPLWEQLRRFGTTTSGRKELLARAFAEDLPAPATPGPLARLLEDMGTTTSSAGPSAP